MRSVAAWIKRPHESHEARVPTRTDVGRWHALFLALVSALLLLSVSGCEDLLDLIDPPPPEPPQRPATPQPPAPLPTLSIADADLVEEGDVAEFAVTLSAASEVPVTARYVTEDGTAEAGPGGDYTHASGSVTFSPGEQAQVIIVETLPDDVHEVEREIFTVRLSAPERATVGERDVARATILDSDDPRVKATRIEPGPRAGRLDTADDVDDFFVEVNSSALVIAATDRGKADRNSDYRDSVVRINGGDGDSVDDNRDEIRVSFLTTGTIEIYIQVSSDGPTPYDLFVWVLDERDYPRISDDVADSSFDIELHYLGREPTPAQRDVFRQAAEVWERVITGGLSDRFIDSSEARCGDGDPSLFGTHIDDLLVYIGLKSLDGPGGALAEAGPCWTRLPSHLPFIGTVTIDTADLPVMERNGVLGKVVTHEIGHALGFGIIWDQIPPEGPPFLQQPSVVNGFIEVPGRDTHFSGPAAVAAFDAVGGDAYRGGAKVPVENDTVRYGIGALDGHWRESVLGHELMTSSLSIEPGVHEPLSIVTIAALEDLGYSVDDAAAEQYTLPSTPPGTVRAASQVLHLLNDIRQGPVRVEDPLDQSIEVILR